MNKQDGLKFIIFMSLCCIVFILVALLSKTEKKSEITTESEAEQILIITETLTHEETTETTTEKETESTTEKETETATTEWIRENTDYLPANFRYDGVWYMNGTRYTWYSEKVLPGRGLKIPGRHSDGDFVRDEEEYIVVASSDHPKGTVVDTPFGEGKVYDTGCPSGTIDIYTSWG